MSTTGKWLLILGIVALVGAIAFGWSIAAFGVMNDDYGISVGGQNIIIPGLKLGGLEMGNAEILFADNGTRIRYDFEKHKDYSGELDGSGISDIKIILSSCRAEVVCADTNKITVAYKTGGSPINFLAETKDGILTVEEKMNITLFNFGSVKPSELTLTVPENLYNDLEMTLASGRIHSSAIKADKFKANVASGSLELGMYAQDIKVNLASGKIILNNCTDEAADDINVQTASGSIEMNGFRADNTKVELASGNVTLGGISGKVKGELASGKLVMTFAEWNDDLDIKLLSGKCDVTLPAGSGVEASLKRLSGGMDIDLDGKTASLTGNSQFTVGGSNVHNVNGDVASGKITIHN